MTKRPHDDSGRRIVLTEPACDEGAYRGQSLGREVLVADRPGESGGGAQVLHGVQAPIPVPRCFDVSHSGGSRVLSSSPAAAFEQQVVQPRPGRRLRHQIEKRLPNLHDRLRYVAGRRRVSPVVMLMGRGKPYPATALIVDRLHVVLQRPDSRAFWPCQVVGKALDQRQP